MLPPECSGLLDGVAASIGPADLASDDPFQGVEKAHAVVAASRLRYDGTVMDRAPELRVISRSGIGYDRIAVSHATARGIAVCNAPDAPTVSTAEHTVTLMLSVAKRIKQAERELRKGAKRDFFSGHTGIELRGLQLGLIGLGRIGGYVARIARALGMQVVAFDPYVSPVRVAELGAESAPSLEALLSTSDVVSLHVPLTAATRHLLSSRQNLAQMKPGAILVNTARGELVDEEALLHALETGRLAGAGLDVTDPEPAEPDNPLLHREDVVLTPHVAAATAAAKVRLHEAAVVQALQVLAGKRPPHLVNPEVWDTRKPTLELASGGRRP